MLEIPFSGHIGESFSRQSSQESLTNMFSQVDPGRTQVIRRQRPGLTLRDGTATGSSLRGMQLISGLYYFVIDDMFYSWDAATYSSTTIGQINSTGSRLCTFAGNAAGQIAVCDQLDLWVWDGTTFSQVTEVGWSPRSISSLAGYGIIDDSLGTGRFYTTALNDFTTVDSLDFANAQAGPDDIVRIFVNRGEAWMFGASTVEAFQLSGASFPLSKITGSEMQRGCGAAFSVATDDNTVFWLGDDGIFYRAEGYHPVRISTHAIENPIANLSDEQRAAAQAFFYQVEGNKFYTVRFPGQLTVQYNVATGLWNYADTYLRNDWEIVGSLGYSDKFVMTASGIAELDPSVNTDLTGIMRREAVTPPIYNNGDYFTVFNYYLDCEVGRTTEAAAPEVMLEVSRDGESWGNILHREMGQTGKYKTRVMWRKLGTAREMQFRLSVSDNVQWKIMGAGGNIVGAVA